ncbi:MAG: TlpA disulfide reductase family protein, partial [Acidimicrobiales bacterium]
AGPGQGQPHRAHPPPPAGPRPGLLTGRPGARGRRGAIGSAHRGGRRLRLAGLALVLAALGAGCSSGTARAQVGKVAPATEGPAIVEGERVDLATFRGRPTLVNFWGSWCDPCRRELPRLVEAQQAGTAVVVVAVEDSRRRAREMLGAFHATWPSIDDPDRRISRRWGVGGGFPVTFAVDAQGIVRGSHIGEMTSQDVATLAAMATPHP